MVTGFCFPGVNTWGWGGRVGWRARLSAKAGRSQDPRRPLCAPAGRAGPGHRSSAAAPAPGLRVHLAPPPPQGRERRLPGFNSVSLTPEVSSTFSYAYFFFGEGPIAFGGFFMF